MPQNDKEWETRTGDDPIRVDTHINPTRLRGLMNGINGFGRDPAGGWSRVGYSQADRDVRAWFAAEMETAGLTVRQDAVGNVFGRFGPVDGPVILVGSHLDTVPQGGAYDGTLGVAVALEAVRAMAEAGLQPQTAIEVVATAEEEGRFGGMLGSQAMAGQATSDWLETARDADGIALTDAMRAAGLDPDGLGAAWRGDVAAFLELHIEQGPVLETTRRAVGLVTAVSGCCVLQITLSGTANHSGTTPMEMRADAFAGLAMAAAGIPGLIARVGTDQSRVTIGKVDLSPGAPHTIPGEAVFSVVIRDTDEAVMEALKAEFLDSVERAAQTHRLRAALAQRSWIKPVALDPELRRIFRQAAEARGLAYREMPSGAGHDAQTMAALCPSALVFVPSHDGISHSPGEHTDWHYIPPAAQLMLDALIRISDARPRATGD